MKLSSHALTFLQAQYRAIFKRAYIKGLATAVLLTAGLAAGQAQAAAGDNILDAADFSSGTSIPAGQTITQDSILDLKDLEANQVGSDSWTYINEQTIDGADVTIKGADAHLIGVSGTSSITVQNGGSLNITSNKNYNTLFYGGGSSANSGTLTATGEDSSINVQSVLVEFNQVEVNSGASIRLGGMYDADAESLKTKPDNSHDAQWMHYTEMYANYTSNGMGGLAEVKDGTLNLDHQSIFGADGEVKILDNSTVNFNGDWRAIEKGTGYATAILRANKVAASNVTISGSKSATETKTPVVNVLDGKHGAIFAPNINITQAQINIGAGSSLTLDGDWAENASQNKKTAATEDMHSATTLTLDNVTFDNQGTVIIGNAQSGGTATVKGEVTLKDKVKNFATVTISGATATPGKLIISEDQILKQKDASGNAIEAGWFAGKASGIVLSGDSIDGATLQLVGTGANGLNLNNDVTFASQADVDGSKTAGKIYVQKSGTLAGEHFVLESALSLPTSGKLGLEADVFEIGTATGKTNTLADFGAEQYAAHDRVVLEASGDNFTINKALNLSRDFYTKDDSGDSGDYTTTSNGYGTIEGDNLSLGTSSASGALTIKGGAYRNEGQTLTLTSGSLTVGAEEADATGIATNDGADADGWDYYKNGNPASLTWTGKFDIAGQTNADSMAINVTGAKGADATLDLTGASVEWGNGKITLSGSATDFEGDQVSATDYFARAGFGTLAITGNQFSDFLDLDDADETATQMIVSGGGVLLVKGAVTGPINFNKFTSTGSAQEGHVHFSGEGMLLSTGDLSLETGVDTDGDKDVEESEIQKLDLGSGAIGAVGITINNRNPALNEADAELADDFVEVSGGALAVTSRFDSSNNEVKFTKSKLVLDSAFLSNYGVSTTASGVAAVHKLTFSGDGTGTAGKSAGLEVWAGDWTVGTGGTLGDIDLTGGAKIEVGNYHAEFVRNGQTASLQADNVGIDGSGSILINEGGSATFNTLQAGTGAAITVSGGSLTLTGIVNETDITADSVPATLADIGTLDAVKAQAGIALNDASISVDGGSLVLGDAAATALVKFSATEDPTTGYVAINDAIAEADITLTNAAVLKLDFSESSAAAINTGAKAGLITKEQARELKDELVDALERGSYINIGELGLDIIYDSGSMTAQWTDLKDFVHVVSGQVGNNVTERLLVQGITSSDNDISGQFGALEAATVGQNSIRVDGTLGLHEARAGYFVSQVGANGTRSPVGLALNSYSDVTLHGEGTVGTLQGTSTSDDTLVIFKEGTYQPGTTTIEATTGSDGIVNVGRVEVDNDVLVKGDVKVGSLAVTKSLVADNVNLDGGANGTSAVFGSLEVAENLTVGSTNSNSLYVADGVVTAESLTLLNGSTLYVGWDGADADVKGTDIDESKPYSGEFYAGTVDLGQGGIVVDPAVTDPTAIAALGQFTNGTKYKNGVQSETSLDLGNANGNLFVGQNSALGLGFANKDELKAYIAAHQSNGALSEYQAIAALNGTVTLNAGYGLTMTGQNKTDFVTYLKDHNWAVSDTYGTVANTVFFGEGTALKISAEAMAHAAQNNKALVTLSGDDGTLVADGGSILISGEVRAQRYQLFTDADGKVAVVDIDHKTVDSNGIVVRTENGFLIGDLNNTNGGTVDLSINPERSLMSGASDPVYATLVEYAQGYKVVGEDENGEIHEQLYDGYAKDSTGHVITDSEGNPTKNYNYGNYFLDGAISTGNGAAAEAAARLGVYGGAPQAALSAGKSSTDAIAQRFGIGAAVSNLTLAGNTQGATLWLAPVYKSADSDGFDAQSVYYGVDVDLYGIALGADYTLSNGVTFGAMFNVGSGDIDGEGAAAAVSNDFDYYGFGVYAGYSVGQFSVIGDVSYTVADNELEANTSVDKIGAQMDSSNLSLGVTGKYSLALNGVNVTPHAGLRFSSIDLDDYTIDGEDVVAAADSDSLNLFAIPVGVTIAKEFKGESWTVAPSLDLTVTGQFGDDELDGDVTWAGVSNLTTHTTTEVIDNFTYGATLGVEAQSVGGVALGLSVGYTGSSNTDEFGVNANARFTF